MSGFLKEPVDERPRGDTRTERGAAYAPGVVAGAADPAADWGGYNGQPSGTRYSPLTQITSANVSGLRAVCAFPVGERVPMQAGPVVVGGTLFVTTATATYAVDAASCRPRWKHRYRYTPKPDYDLRVNRGVAYVETPDGALVVRGSNDGRVYAIDARTGRERWNVRAGDPALGETFPAAPVAWRGLVYIGNAGGDNYGVSGRMMAFDARTGARVWSTELIPRSGPAAFSWPAEQPAVPRAGAATWTTYTVDTLAGVLYVPTGNAAPDFLTSVRPGKNLHATSVVALDLRTGLLLAGYKIVEHDFHDWDVAAAPLLATTREGRQLIAVGAKDGFLHALERPSGRPLFRTAVTTRLNADAPLTREGTRFCPGVQGGVEWNGPAYDSGTNLLIVGSVDWCTTVRVRPPAELVGRAGLPWTGSARQFEPFGRMDPKERARGWLTAVDADDGRVRWRHPFPAPVVAGVTATAGGVVFTADLAGNVVAFDSRTGRERWRYHTGQPVGGGIASYAVGGRQYVAVASGLDSPLAWKRRSSKARVIVFGLR